MAGALEPAQGPVRGAGPGDNLVGGGGRHHPIPASVHHQQRLADGGQLPLHHLAEPQKLFSEMARLAAPLVAPGGFLFVASCSHHAPLEAWAGQIAWGLHRARRAARILATTGAGPDHPVHPHLPESAYLKAQLLQLV